MVIWWTCWPKRPHTRFTDVSWFSTIIIQPSKSQILEKSSKFICAEVKGQDPKLKSQMLKNDWQHLRSLTSEMITRGRDVCPLQPSKVKVKSQVAKSRKGTVGGQVLGSSKTALPWEWHTGCFILRYPILKAFSMEFLWCVCLGWFFAQLRDLPDLTKYVPILVVKWNTLCDLIQVGLGTANYLLLITFNIASSHIISAYQICSQLKLWYWSRVKIEKFVVACRIVVGH